MQVAQTGRGPSTSLCMIFDTIIQYNYCKGSQRRPCEDLEFRDFLQTTLAKKDRFVYTWQLIHWWWYLEACSTESLSFVSRAWLGDQMRAIWTNTVAFLIQWNTGKWFKTANRHQKNDRQTNLPRISSQKSVRIQDPLSNPVKSQKTLESHKHWQRSIRDFSEWQFYSIWLLLRCSQKHHSHLCTWRMTPIQALSGSLCWFRWFLGFRGGGSLGWDLGFGKGFADLWWL